MTQKYTQGEWRVETSEDDEAVIITADCREGFIPIATIEVGFIGKIEEEQQANILLLKSAPDLLAAAETAIYEMRHTVAPRNSFTEAVDLLDAAISKARGE